MIRPLRSVRHTLALLGVTALLSIASADAVEAQAPSPSARVVSPSGGSTVRGPSVTVQVDVSGISLVRSTVPVELTGNQPSANRPDEGHLHYMLDLRPMVMTTQRSHTFEDVTPGEHVLRVELTQNDHSPLSPPVVHEIRFTTVADPMLPQSGRGANLRLLAFVGLALVTLGAVLAVCRGRLSGDAIGNQSLST
jgi:hypothetical protein